MLISNLFCQEKKKDGTLKDDISNSRSLVKKVSGCLWNSKTSDTTKLESIDIKKECLVKETSFNYGKRSVFADRDSDLTPKGLRIKTVKALRKLLRKIVFLSNENDNVLVDFSFMLPPSIKNLVNVLEKLVVIRKLFLKVNSFRRASTSSKFAGIIRVMFTFESSLMQTIKKAKSAKILVNNDLKKSAMCLDQTVVVKKIPIGMSADTVCAAMFKYAVVKFGKIEQANLVVACWFILIEKNMIPRCVVVCFNSIESLNAVIKTTSVCEKSGHISLGCILDKKFSSGGLFHRVFLDANKSRLAAIYAKHSALVAHPVLFGGASWTQIADESFFLSPPLSNDSVSFDSSLKIKPTPLVSVELNNKFAALECSLTSLAEQVDKLAKRLDALGSMNQEVDIVMSKSLGVITSGETVVEMVIFNLLVVSKLEGTLNNLVNTVMDLLARIENASLGFDIIWWHKNINNLILIFTETKLKKKVCSWITNKFNGVWVFTSGVTKNVNLQLTDIYNIQKKRPKTSSNIWCSPIKITQQQQIQNGNHTRHSNSRVLPKSVYQYIENCINNYLFGNYNILEVRSNLYNNLVHYSQLGTEDLNSETLATYFQELNFNIIKYCEKKYPVQSKYSFDFELKTETSNKGKQRLKQYSRTIPNTPILQKTTAKHLQTSEQGTSVKLPLSITPFPISLVQPQTPSSLLNYFFRPENFQSPRNPT
ncbi:hypothetical protein G9A89_022716 [Geosiphon pyriformis]|nr:hypothetical protein G9A89_022716 [Geosiphon pyriformis]